MFYGSTVWDPVLITAQIITMQCLFYASLGLTLWMFVGAASASSISKGKQGAASMPCRFQGLCKLAKC